MLVVSVHARITHTVTNREAAEDGDTQVQADVLAEVMAQLSSEGVGVEAADVIVVGAESRIEVQFRIVASLGDLDAMFRTLQSKLLRAHFRLKAHGLFIDLFRIGDIQRSDMFELSLGGRHHTEAIRTGQFQQLCQREHRHPMLIISLCSRQTAACQSRYLLRQFRDTGLPVIDKCLQTSHLHGVDGNLTMSNGRNLHIIEYLHIGLRHLHPDIVLGLLKISSRCLQIQTVHLDVLWYLETRKERHRRCQLETGILGVPVLVEVIFGKTTSEVEVLSHGSCQIRQSAVNSR